MAKKSPRSVSKDGQVVKFTIDVTAVVKKGKVSAIDFDMNLNPDRKILQIEEKLSSYEDLLGIFDEIKRVLTDIQSRTDKYNSVLKIDYKQYEKLFNKGYEENLTPSFGKIDSIHYVHNSPENFNVSYAKSCNGDQKPPSR